MVVSKALGWLCEEPEHSFTLNKIFRRGWPGLANFFLLPKQLNWAGPRGRLKGACFWEAWPRLRWSAGGQRCLGVLWSN